MHAEDLKARESHFGLKMPTLASRQIHRFMNELGADLLASISLYLRVWGFFCTRNKGTKAVTGEKGTFVCA